MHELTEDIRALIRTRRAIVTMRTLDEEFASKMIRQAAREMQMSVMEWSVAEGLRCVEPPAGEPIGGTHDLAGALKFIRGNSILNIYVLKDAIKHLNTPICQRVMREIGMEFSADHRTVFMIDHDGALPASIQPVAVPVNIELPNAKEIVQLARKCIRELTQFGKPEIEMSQAESEQFLANLRGLTRMEISQVMAEAVLGDGKLDADDIGRVIEMKRQRFSQSGVLDYIPMPDDPPKVGGMANLLDWLAKRAKALGSKAKDYGLETPRGILMLGVQGCGKSLMAKVVASQWQLPLLRMDIGALYDKFVGETERHLREAFKISSAMAPCVLWIDEVEKAFASAGAGAAGAASDGGLSQRMFGQLLTWMQDRKEPVFLIATANDISALPPELMRKGRFDEIFFVDLPSQDARAEIFRIHLSRRGRKADSFDIAALGAKADGFSGSEIEQAVVSAMYAAFNEDRELTSDDILEELDATQPLSVVMAEKIAELRQWAKGRCVSAD